MVFATGSVAASAVTGNMQKRAMGDSKLVLMRGKASAEEEVGGAGTGGAAGGASLRGREAGAAGGSPRSRGDRCVRTGTPVHYDQQIFEDTMA